MRGTCKSNLLALIVITTAACGGAQPEPLTTAPPAHTAQCESLHQGLAGEHALEEGERASWEAAVARLELAIEGELGPTSVPATRHQLAEAWYRLETDAWLGQVERYCSVPSNHRCEAGETAPLPRYGRTIQSLQHVVSLHAEYEQMDVVLKELVVVLSRAGRTHEAGYYARGLQLHFPESPYAAAGELAWPTTRNPS